MKKRRFLEGGSDFYTAVLKEAYNPVDRIMLLLPTIFWVGFVFAATASTSWVVLVVVGLIIVYTIAHVRNHITVTTGNALQTQVSKSSTFQSIVHRVSENLGVGHVGVYIIKDIQPRFTGVSSFRKNELFLEAEALESMTEAEQEAIVVQQMSYIAFRTLGPASHIRPIGELIKIPLLASLIHWSFGFWSRRIVLTADAVAVLYTRNPHALIMALIKAEKGAFFAAQYAEDSILMQSMEQNRFFSTPSQSTQDYPFLTTRLRHIAYVCEKYQINLPPEYINFQNVVRRNQAQSL